MIRDIRDVLALMLDYLYDHIEEDSARILPIIDRLKSFNAYAVLLPPEISQTLYAIINEYFVSTLTYTNEASRWEIDLICLWTGNSKTSVVLALAEMVDEDEG